MNPWQLTQAIIAALAGSTSGTPNFAWNDSPSDPILSRVLVGVAIPDFFQQDAALPDAFIHVDQTRDNSEVPADVTEEQRWSIYLFAANATDQSGGAAVVGANRQSLGTSRGRGLLEIEPLVKAKLFNMIGLVGRPRSQDAQPVSPAGKMLGLIAERVIGIVATRLPALPAFSPVQRLKGASAAAISFYLRPRYDLIGYSWVKGVGLDPTVATFVASAGGAVSFLAGTGAGTYTFWAAYDMTVDPFNGIGDSSGLPNRWSSSQTAQDGVLYLPASITVAS